MKKCLPLILFAVLASALYAAKMEPWSWKDAHGIVRSQQELDAALQAEGLWKKSRQKDGKCCTDLSGAQLNDADLIGAFLLDANLSGADLTGAKLIGANLGGAKLRKTDFGVAHLEGAELGGADLSGADLYGAHLGPADLCGLTADCVRLDQLHLNAFKHAITNLGNANLSGANLSGADLREAHLRGADLENADLSDANLAGATLGGVDLRGADLSGADLDGAEFAVYYVRGAIYEPAKYPAPEEFQSIRDLGYLTWKENSAAIFALRKSLIDGGFLAQAKQVNAAIHRKDESVLELIFFDWTCEWGANSLRPLLLAVAVSMLCTLIYWVGMHFGVESGLYLVASAEPISTDNSKLAAFRISVRPPGSTPIALPLSAAQSNRSVWTFPKCATHFLYAIWKVAWRRIYWELRALETAMQFSLTSVLNLGFEGFAFGNWVRMLRTKEYEIKAHGWMRTISGIQAIIGFGLVSLSLLSYFGHPFD